MKTVENIMTVSPATCSPDTPLQDVARMMVDNDCGCIPVVETQSARVPIGVITDRDIASRVVAEGRDARALSASDAMTRPVISVARDASLEDCLRTMTEHQLRRVVLHEDLAPGDGPPVGGVLGRDVDHARTPERVEMGELRCSHDGKV